METQIREAYRKAFLASDFDPEWLTRLYTEIRDRLLNLVPKNGNLAKEIEEMLDPAFFRQQIEHNVFCIEDMRRLVCYVFATCLKLGSPARDESTMERQDKVLAIVTDNFQRSIPIFVLEANETLDEIEEDIRNLLPPPPPST